MPEAIQIFRRNQLASDVCLLMRQDGNIAMAIFASYVIGQFMPLVQV
jgi:hypothetical protein